MTDFSVMLERLPEVAQAFAENQRAPSGLQGASTVRTGDPGLDRTVQQDADEFVKLLNDLANRFDQNAQGLKKVAENYQSADGDIASGFDQIGGGGGAGSNGPASPSGEGTPVASRIKDLVNPSG